MATELRPTGPRGSLQPSAHGSPHALHKMQTRAPATGFPHSTGPIGLVRYSRLPMLPSSTRLDRGSGARSTSGEDAGVSSTATHPTTALTEERAMKNRAPSRSWNPSDNRIESLQLFIPTSQRPTSRAPTRDRIMNRIAHTIVAIAALTTCCLGQDSLPGLTSRPLNSTESILVDDAINAIGLYISARVGARLHEKKSQGKILRADPVMKKPFKKTLGAYRAGVIGICGPALTDPATLVATLLHEDTHCASAEAAGEPTDPKVEPPITATFPDPSELQHGLINAYAANAVCELICHGAFAPAEIGCDGLKDLIDTARTQLAHGGVPPNQLGDHVPDRDSLEKLCCCVPGATPL